MRDESWVDRRWFVVLAGVAVTVETLSVARALSHPRRPALNIDSAFFEHAGWYVTQGAVLYRDIWDIKPPLAVETTALLAVLAGGDPLGIHLSSVAVTGVAAVGCSLLVGVLAHRLTGDGRAALLSGLVLATMPGFFYFSANGFRPKYLMLCFGLAGLRFALRRRPVLAGTTAAAAAGYWQYGAIFPILVIAIAFRERDSRALVRTLLGMAVTTAVVVAPIVAWGATIPMMVEVVSVPLAAQPATPLIQRLGKLLLYLAYALVPVVVGVYGLATAGRRGVVEHWWVYVGAAWGVVQVLFDLDSAPDLYVLVVFVAFGVALFVRRTQARSRRWLSVAVAGFVLLNAAWVGGVVSNPVADHTATGTDGLRGALWGVSASVGVSDRRTPSRHGVPGVRTLFWHTEIPPSCHYRLSGTERAWLAKTGRPYIASQCGSLHGL